MSGAKNILIFNAATLKQRMHYCPSIIDVSRSPHAGWEDSVKGYATHSGLKGRRAVAQTHRRRTHIQVTIFLVVSSLLFHAILNQTSFRFFAILSGRCDKTVGGFLLSKPHSGEHSWGISERGRTEIIEDGS